MKWLFWDPMHMGKLMGCALMINNFYGLCAWKIQKVQTHNAQSIMTTNAPALRFTHRDQPSLKITPHILPTMGQSCLHSQLTMSSAGWDSSVVISGSGNKKIIIEHWFSTILFSLTHYPTLHVVNIHFTRAMPSWHSVGIGGLEIKNNIVFHLIQCWF